MSTDNVNQPHENEPEPGEAPSNLPANWDWDVPPFEEGKTWQGPEEEWQARAVFDDISTEELDATKAALWARLKVEPDLNLADPKLWRELIQEVGTNRSTVGMAVFIVTDEQFLNSH